MLNNTKYGEAVQRAVGRVERGEGQGKEGCRRDGEGRQVERASRAGASKVCRGSEEGKRKKKGTETWLEWV